MPGPRRIVLIGVTGSGKSTLAARIGELIAAPAVSMDDIYWGPGWTKLPAEQRAPRYATLVDQERWVVDSLPSVGRTVLLARADLVVALDYPRWFSLQRLLRRTVRRLVTREQVCNGNTENLTETLGRDSIIAWHFRSYDVVRGEIRALEIEPGAPPVIRLASRRATDDWLQALGYC